VVKYAYSQAIVFPLTLISTKYLRTTRIIFTEHKFFDVTNWEVLLLFSTGLEIKLPRPSYWATWLSLKCRYPLKVKLKLTALKDNKQRIKYRLVKGVYKIYQFKLFYNSSHLASMHLQEAKLILLVVSKSHCTGTTSKVVNYVTAWWNCNIFILSQRKPIEKCIILPKTFLQNKTNYETVCDWPSNVTVKVSPGHEQIWSLVSSLVTDISSVALPPWW